MVGSPIDLFLPRSSELWQSATQVLLHHRWQRKKDRRRGRKKGEKENKGKRKKERVVREGARYYTNSQFRVGFQVSGTGWVRVGLGFGLGWVVNDLAVGHGPTRSWKGSSHSVV